MIAEKIQEYIQRLPVSFQAEVLDFIEYLLAKAERQGLNGETGAWSDFSMKSAMRGMEDEKEPAYTAADLIEIFR